jgi:hypothetical protein
MSGKPKLPLIIGGAVVGLALIITLVVVLWPGSKHHAPKYVAAPTAASLSSGANQLISLLNHGATVTYNATYKATTATTPTITLEVWQSPPDVREDVIQTNGKQSARDAAITVKAGSQLCSQTGSGPWSCTPISTAQSNAIGLGGAVSTFLSELGGRAVKTSTSTVAGMPARCFESTGPDAGTLCASDSGIPLSITDQKVSYQAVTVTSTVTAGVFATPPTNG